MDKKERKNYHSYHIQGCSQIHTVKSNVIFLNNHNTVLHELGKCLGAIMVHKFGDLKFSPETVGALRVINEEVGKLNLVKCESNFITEAVPNEDKSRRVDLVGLRDNVRFEFETDAKNIKKDNVITVLL